MTEKVLLINLLNKRNQLNNKKINFKINHNNNSLSIHSNEPILTNNNKTKKNILMKSSYKTVMNSSLKENEPIIKKKPNLLIE